MTTISQHARLTNLLVELLGWNWDAAPDVPASGREVCSDVANQLIAAGVQLAPSLTTAQVPPDDDAMGQAIDRLREAAATQHTATLKWKQAAAVLGKLFWLTQLHDHGAAVPIRVFVPGPERCETADQGATCLDHGVGRDRACEACLPHYPSGLEPCTTPDCRECAQPVPRFLADVLIKETPSTPVPAAVTTPKAETVVVLTVNRSDSRCGACHRNADPNERAHVMERMRGEGCGATFTHVTTGYIGAEESVRLRRPDLTWLDFWSTPEAGGPQ